MRVLTIDFETYWDTDYTLSKLTTEHYVRDPRFRAHMVGIKNGDNPTVIVPEAQIQSVFNKIDWSTTAVLCQHCHFDGLILSHHYNVHPAFLLDTLSMFRSLYPAESASLANQTRVLGFPPKGNGYNVVSTKGKEYLTPEEYKACAAYCQLDCDLTWRIFNALKSKVSTDELRLIDMTVRLFTEPVLRLNSKLLREAHKEEIEAKAALMAKIAQDKDTLSSNPKFAQVLMDMGIDPPKKISPAAIKNGKVHIELIGETPSGMLPDKAAVTAYELAHGEEHPHKYWAYAFGKADEEFKKLLEHEDPMVQALVEARMGVKSTIKQTRTERFLSIASRGTLPIYLNYASTHTGRWSGGGQINPQNLNRGSKLRESIEAPEGHVLVVRDLSAIEARVNAWLAGQDDMLDTFRRGEDIYCQMASSITGRTVTKEDKSLRFLGKAVTLGCGYSLGWRKFQQMLRVGMLGDSGRILGTDVAQPLGVNLTGFASKFAGYINESLPPGVDTNTHALHCACAEAIIRAFRDNKPFIPRMWNSCQESLDHIIAGSEFTFGRNNCISTNKEGLVLPSGRMIRYVDLRVEMHGKKKEYTILKDSRSGRRAKVYGGLLDENLCQALARDIIAFHMLLIGRRYRIVTTTHDEIVCAVPEDEAEECLEFMGEVMATPPAWCADLPLSSEGGFAANYSK